VALDDPLRPVWVTEIGYNVAYAHQTESGQANYLGAVYRVLASRLLSDGSREIPVVFWFKYEDFPQILAVMPKNGVWCISHLWQGIVRAAPVISLMAARTTTGLLGMSTATCTNWLVVVSVRQSM
jgi:hypothetical protein